MITFHAWPGLRPRRSVTVSHSDGAHAAFVYGNTLGLRDIHPFEVQSHAPHGSCLHFRPRVAATPARLGSDLPATALAGQDSHPQAITSFHDVLPLFVEHCEAVAAEIDVRRRVRRALRHSTKCIQVIRKVA